MSNIVDFPGKDKEKENEDQGTTELSHLSISFRDDGSYVIREERGLSEITIHLPSGFDVFTYLQEALNE